VLERFVHTYRPKHTWHTPHTLRVRAEKKRRRAENKRVRAEKKRMRAEKKRFLPDCIQRQKNR